MKKTGIRLFIALLFIGVFILGTTIPAVAAPPQRATVVITGIEDTTMTFTLYWEDDLKWTDYGLTLTRYPTGSTDPADRETFYDMTWPYNPEGSNSIWFSYTNENEDTWIESGYSYDIEMVLFSIWNN